MFRIPFRVLPFLLPLAPAWAQEAPDAGVVRAYMEGCLQNSQSQGPDAARDFCKCTAKLIFPGSGEVVGDPMEAMMQCQPGMREFLDGN